MKFLVPQGAAAMAVMLLWTGVAATMGGCLTPQDDQVFPELPPKKNSPPRIVKPLQPDQREKTIFVGPASTSCPRQEFSVLVSDEDTGDTIRSKWFVGTDTVGTAGSQVFGGSDVSRTVKAPSTVLTQLTSLIDGKKHNVEVWITDGEFDGDTLDVRRPRTVYFDGTVSLDCSSTGEGADAGPPPFCDVAYKDNYLWLVEVQLCP